MDPVQLSFKEGNPGAVQFGNFINYYQFHPPDIRLKKFPIHMFELEFEKSFHGLDLGCNSGDLTISIYNLLNENEKCKDCRILGVDIDPILIKRAHEKLENNGNISFKSLDIMSNDGLTTIRKYLEKHNLSKFDATFCFSITMWIHLNHGDEGLKRFLQTICDLSRFVVLEAQPWKCYKSAVKRMKSSNFQFPLFKELKIRQTVEEVIEDYLVRHCKTIKIYESGRSEWGRKLQVFKK